MRARAMIAAILLLGGCAAAEPAPTTETSTTSSTTTSSSSTTTTEPPPVSLPQSVVDEVYLELLRDESLIFAVSDDQTLLDLGRSYCELIDAAGGDTDAAVLAVAQAAIGSDMDPGAAGYAMGAAVTAFCPEHQDALSVTFSSGG